MYAALATIRKGILGVHVLRAADTKSNAYHVASLRCGGADTLANRKKVGCGCGSSGNDLSTGIDHHEIAIVDYATGNDFADTIGTNPDTLPWSYGWPILRHA